MLCDHDTPQYMRLTGTSGYSNAVHLPGGADRLVDSNQGVSRKLFCTAVLSTAVCPVPVLLAILGSEHMQTPHILIVEDELVTRNTLKSIFEAEGYMVYEATDGAEMHQIITDHDINLVIMDINLPGKNGLLLARELREQASVALMFLTGRDNEVDKILGLEIGADDYITKPFNPRELTIRARNLLSRTMNLAAVDEERKSVESYRFNGWELDINSRSLVNPQGEVYKLPRSEFRAMLHFCENPGKIQTRADLLKKMTGRELKPHDRTVDVTIRRIRKHFESIPDTPEIIATIHGEGYRFCGDLED